MIARQLRRLYQHPAQALAIVRADAASHDAAARALPMLQEIGTTRNQPLILEALFIAENMITGPQHSIMPSGRGAILAEPARSAAAPVICAFFWLK